MRVNYQEIARLKGKEVSNRGIAIQMSISRTTVNRIISELSLNGLKFQSVATMSDEELSAALGKNTNESRDVLYTLPDYEAIVKDLSRPGVTIQLLWEEYKDQCRLNKTQHYQLTQFKKYLHQHLEKTDFTEVIKHRAGDKIEVDWAGTRPSWKDPDTGEIIRGYLFVGVLPFSGFAFARTCSDMTQHNWIESHVQMFEYFEGVSKIIIPDNLKVGITKHTKHEVIINQTYFDLAEHYGMVVIPARVRKPRDKSTAEGSVNIFTTQIIAKLRDYQFFSIDEYNRQLLVEVDKVNHKPFQKKEGSRYSVFHELERDTLLPLPPIRFILFTRTKAKVYKNSHISFQKCFYSVPYSYIGHEVSLKVFHEHIEIYYDFKLLCKHSIIRRNYDKYSTELEHMPPNSGQYSAWNSTRYLNWAKTKGPYTHQVVQRIFDGKYAEQKYYNSVHSIIKLADTYSVERLEKSCQLALERDSSPSYKHIKAILLNNQDVNDSLNENSISETSRFARGGSYFDKR